MHGRTAKMKLIMHGHTKNYVKFLHGHKRRSQEKYTKFIITNSLINNLTKFHPHKVQSEIITKMAIQVSSASVTRRVPIRGWKLS